ncbi:MAG TPA: membrane-bound O-acyltransferase family protein [Lachnospiraceae bacterium]|nr:membrane-bound O-acyltransferase family protein [Lachnospiraceae bacterium]
MIFSTYKFILVFLPVVFFGYYILNHFRYYQLSKIWLVLASLFFYAQGSPAFFPFFLGSVFGNYAVGTCLSHMREDVYRIQRKILMIMGVLANVGLLGYFKYTDFFLENINAFAGTDIPLRNIVLPIGISFFTFQLIAFLVDSYKGETKEYDILHYLLFITFFPQLIVGPIVHHGEIVPQFEKEENLKLNHEKIALGIFVFTIGCAKKMLLADPMNVDAETFYSHVPDSVTMLESWFYTLEYSLSYYFDLSGYTDMAIGLGYMFGVKLPENFNAPFRSTDMQQYWQRQHMTLSRFLGNYVFKSYFRKGSRWRNYYMATMVTFLVSGIWHGAGWNFVLWGLINGLLVCIGAYRSYHKKKTPRIPAMFLTFLCIVLTRVIFVAKNMADAWAVYQGMFCFSGLFGDGWHAAAWRIYHFCLEHMELGILVLIGLAICYLAPTTKTLSEKFRPGPVWLAYTGVLLAVCLSGMDQVVQFLYFQF